MGDDDLLELKSIDDDLVTSNTRADKAFFILQPNSLVTSELCISVTQIGPNSLHSQHKH